MLVLVVLCLPHLPGDRRQADCKGEGEIELRPADESPPKVLERRSTPVIKTRVTYV